MPNDFNPDEKSWSFIEDLVNKGNINSFQAEKSFKKFIEYNKNNISDDWQRDLRMWLLREWNRMH